MAECGSDSVVRDARMGLSYFITLFLHYFIYVAPLLYWAAGLFRKEVWAAVILSGCSRLRTTLFPWGRDWECPSSVSVVMCLYRLTLFYCSTWSGFTNTMGSFVCVFVFNKRKVCSNPATSKSVNTIFPIVLAHFMSVSYFGRSHNILYFFIIVYICRSDLWPVIFDAAITEGSDGG